MFRDSNYDNNVDSPGDIERVIEGGEDENNVGSGSENDNEEKNKSGQDEKADEENKGKAKVKRKLGPRNILNVERLRGPRGIGIMESFFSDVQLHGKRKEKEDLENIMRRLEHWAHRMIPSMQFDDCLKKIEKLGSKKTVANYVTRIRLGMEEDEGSKSTQLDEPPDSPTPLVDVDPFDQLLSSTAPTRPVTTDITAEQREQMLRNRLIAEDRRAARIKKAQEMKEKFQATHNFTSQTENSRVVECTTKDVSQNSSISIINGVIEKNINDEQMEIDQNIDNVEEVSDIHDNIKLKNYSMDEDCHMEINYTDVIKEKHKNQSNDQIAGDKFNTSSEILFKKHTLRLNNLTEDKNEFEVLMETDDYQPDVLPHGDKNEFESLMERNECQPHVVTEGNKNVPEVLVKTNKNHSELANDAENKNAPKFCVETNKNHTDLPDGDTNEFESLMERNECQPHVVTEGNKNVPEVLVKTNENHTELANDSENKNAPKYFVETNKNHTDLSGEGIKNIDKIQLDVLKERN